MLSWLRKSGRGEASYAFHEAGFHGDRYLLSLVDDLLRRNGIGCFVETGANVGSTLAYVARRYPGVRAFSCEPDAEAYRRAKGHTRELPNVELHNLRSQDFISALAGRAEVTESRCLFWLDAHGYGFEWPLRDEVSFVASRIATAYVLVDDFEVPGRDDFRFDRYRDQVCCYEHVRGALGSRPHQLFYPAYSERTSRHHPLTGWGLIVMGADYSVPENLAPFISRAVDGAPT